jgi:hypothetical protein
MIFFIASKKQLKSVEKTLFAGPLIKGFKYTKIQKKSQFFIKKN